MRRLFLAAAVALIVLTMTVSCTGRPDPADAAPTVERFVRAVAAFDAESLDDCLAVPSGASVEAWAKALLGASSPCRIDRLDLGEPVEAGSQLEYNVLVESRDIEGGAVYVAVVVEQQDGTWKVGGATGMGGAE